MELKNFGHDEKAGREFRKKYNFKKEDKIIVDNKNFIWYIIDVLKLYYILSLISLLKK